MKFSRKLRLHNLNYHFRRLLKGNGSLESVSSRCIEIAPAHNETSKPSIFHEHELKKIKKLHPETTWEIEKKRMLGGPVEHAASLCWELENVFFTHRDIYKKNFKKSYPDIHSQNIFKTTFEYDSTQPLALTSSYNGIKYFGHWLTDDCCTYELAKDYGKPVSFESEFWPHKNYYAECFSQNWNNYFFGYASKLLIFEDYAQNKSKTQRYRHLRGMLRSHITPKNQGSSVYLKRGNTGNNIRNLVNEDELIQYLKKDGFIIVDITTDSFYEMIEKLLDCDMVVTIEGSQQNHALFTLAENGKLISIQPPNLFNNHSKDWCSVLGFKHGFTVCEETEGGFRVDIDSLLKVIDIAQSQS